MKKLFCILINTITLPIAGLLMFLLPFFVFPYDDDFKREVIVFDMIKNGIHEIKLIIRNRNAK